MVSCLQCVFVQSSEGVLWQGLDAVLLDVRWGSLQAGMTLPRPSMGPWMLNAESLPRINISIASLNCEWTWRDLPLSCSVNIALGSGLCLCKWVEDQPYTFNITIWNILLPQIKNPLCFIGDNSNTYHFLSWDSAVILSVMTCVVQSSDRATLRPPETKRFQLEPDLITSFYSSLLSSDTIAHKPCKDCCRLFFQVL